MRHKGTIMEFSENRTKLKNAIVTLEINMKKKSRVLPSNLRKSLTKLLNNHPDLVTVKGHKIIISAQFYPIWIKTHKLDKETEYVDSSHYKFFRKLRKYGYIHTKSSYFPKKLAVITLNPTMPSLYKGNIRDITSYARAKESLYKVSDSIQSKIDAYIDLRLYQSFMLTSKEIEAINTSDIVFIDESSAYIYIENKGIFDNVKIPPYYLIPIRGLKLISILKQYKQDDIIHPFAATNMEDRLLEHRQEFFSSMSFQEIKMAAQNQLLIYSSPLATTLAASRKIMSQVTISELYSLFPTTIIPEHLIVREKKRILNALERSKESPDEKDDAIDTSFSLDEFEYFDELLKTKNSSSFMKKKESAKRELVQYKSSENPETHGILITKYIAYLLDSVNGDKKTRKIKISTFRKYYSLVRKHLFENVEDLSSVQAHEINVILQNLAINKYKDKSIASVRSRIADFFSFHGKQQEPISINLASYPKSLVFESEIDQILAEIEDNYKKSGQEAQTDYEILRDKAIILMARYTGLRKSELRSRLLKDVYVYGNKLCIDVNLEGLKKLDLRLKTSSAKRRVCVEITDKDHLKIIIDYIELRENIKTKNKFFFLDNCDEKPEVVKEVVFNNLSKIIQKVTKRYTSFHSLRHTFATYAVKEILECKKVNPYKMIDLAVMMGHTSPEITLKKYTHRSVIECILTNKDKK